MRDLYAEVTAKIIADLEKGVAPWVRPWSASSPHGGMPYNALSGKRYRGINVPLLYAAGYADAAWMTYKQAQSIGAQVRKGERGSLIVFFKPFRIEDKNGTRDASGNLPSRTIPMLRSFVVFNVAQIDNLPAKYLPQPDARSEFQRHAEADAMLAQASITHGGDRAFYRIETDAITLPQPMTFATPADYYATALHELTHWTGHSSRCAREFGKRFGDQAYAREELVAEMGAAMLCAQAGIAGQLQHAAYIGNWLEVLRADKKAIFVAASAAQKAADFILGTKPADESADEQEAA